MRATDFNSRESYPSISGERISSIDRDFTGCTFVAAPEQQLGDTTERRERLGLECEDKHLRAMASQYCSARNPETPSNGNGLSAHNGDLNTLPEPTAGQTIAGKYWLFGDDARRLAGEIDAALAEQRERDNTPAYHCACEQLERLIRNAK